MTRQMTSWNGGLRIVVPGTWANVPVDDPARTVAFLKRLVKDQVGTADRLARVRREATQELLVTAREAVGLGVHTFLFSLEMVPGVPFPAAVMMIDEEWPAAGAAGPRATTEDEVRAALTAAYPSGEVAVQRNGPVARVVEMAEGRTSDSEDALPVRTMRLEYHMPYPDRSKLLLIRVNVPNIPSAEPFATLFDEIVDSVSFVAQEDRPSVAG
ncbi:hypothetical protein LEP48_17225 [Isoptericola sp. NEAU-Y5]|uniref:Uncharacterized protein n=1 Tax=Isoptericola luteus TaxID=2879484 RepID=A0ABS7ZN46_9MICO|nr:hypothetical protein [Isoptericola sp. NEAU-Y5]MCA5895074.1 hypothetical protein [Isoptericola sp. NEAU-Y5]